MSRANDVDGGEQCAYVSMSERERARTRERYALGLRRIRARRRVIVAAAADDDDDDNDNDDDDGRRRRTNETLMRARALDVDDDASEDALERALVAACDDDDASVAASAFAALGERARAACARPRARDDIDDSLSVLAHVVKCAIAIEVVPMCARAIDEELRAMTGVVGTCAEASRRSARRSVEAIRALEALRKGSSEAREAFDWSSAMGWVTHESDEVRYNACALVCAALGANARATAEMRRATTRDAARFHEYDARRRERDLEIELERGMFWLRAPASANGEFAWVGDDLASEPPSATDGFVRVGGVEVQRRNADAETSWRREKAMIYTSSARRNIAAVALALCQNRPVLLEGPAGCGKSAALEEVARVTGNVDFITLHLDAQTDSKSLLGAYVCGAAPGEFKWQPGALTQAVTKGAWVLIEDVDLAPFEVLSALVPLLEKRRLYVPGRGESIQAAPGFQLFGSVTTEHGRSTSASADPLSGLWTRVVIEPPRGDEATAILCGLYPRLTQLAHTMLATVRQVQSVCGQGGAAAGEAAGLGVVSQQDLNIQQVTSDGDTSAAMDAELGAMELEAQANDANHALSRVHAGRQYTLRDLLRWARRITILRDNELALMRVDKAAPPQLRSAAYEEAADVLAGMLPTGPGRRRVLKLIAAIWGLPADDAAEATDSLHKPVIREGHQSISIGRCVLPVGEKIIRSAKWSRTGHASRLLERTAAAVQLAEPVLLVGETGTGKTALIQELARLTGAPLTVVNLSNQSESADFLGGFKPVSSRHLCLPLVPKFQNAFVKTFPSAANAEFLARIVWYAEKRKWTHLLHAFRAGVERVTILAGNATKSNQKTADLNPSKRRKTSSALPDELVAEWRKFERDLSAVEISTNASKHGGPVFAFVEGALVTALREGHWILLDEINLAPAETLERLGGILESETGSIVLSERGDGEPIPRHPRFRLFGAMNPATDVGKRDLPAALKHRFVEIYAGETESKEDLAMIVNTYLDGIPGVCINDIVEFYIASRQAAHTTLLDSADQKPQYSLRTLSRACEYVRAATGMYGLQRALFDGFAMSFLTLLKTESGVVLESLMVKHLLRGTALKAMKHPPTAPTGDSHVLLEHFWVEAGDLPRLSPEEGKYVVTPTVRGHLSNLARAVLLRRHPILLQGPTSSGKTSLVEYLALRTGHRFMRINNHEHTDLQEYLGTYITDENGLLVFQEGALVQAVRKGYWIVLDELNLAPTDVLEALNRLLDDNRELFVPELQETIRPHPHFMLFATQNPPGAVYGGRKVLSKAFRNRFMELHIGEIPEEELKTILHTRCEIAPSYCVKLVEVMRELQRIRQGSRAFAGKDGYITARDLFRWANRKSTGYEQLAADGFKVLGERLRSDAERNSIREVLEKCLKVPQLIESTLYSSAQEGVLEQRLKDAAFQAEDVGSLEAADAAGLCQTIAWTPAMRRLFALVEGCMDHKEPALLVGETGCGKTSVCQLLALLRGQKLRILNCHQHTETSDFIGGFRPTRTAERQEMMDNGKTAAPFAWEDGPLIKAMRDGDILLVDELSLAEDSVLERLNSVLEPGRTITLPEKGGAEVEELTAHPDFLILGTMNPGGDFGKKELSPALRNRFTEIWIGSVGRASEMESIVARRMPTASLLPFSKLLSEFWEHYHDIAGSSTARAALAVRDLIGWANFMREMVDSSKREPLSPSEAYAHGAYLTLLDGLGLGLGTPVEAARQIKTKCLDFLRKQLPEKEHYTLAFADAPEGDVEQGFEIDGDGFFGLPPFKIPCGNYEIKRGGFALSAPSTKKNAARIMRAMQLSKPILLEGSPGVGKTSIIAALAAASGHKLVRLNLSEQTDMMDLLGADLPAAGGAAGEFVWSDGAFLAALKAGDWVLLDELNLAPQPVLEGLNAVLDHRAEVFVPELGQTFKCPPTFRVFAAQNPVQEGGGRKGLPKSFLNRFTRVHVEPMYAADFKHISRSLYPGIPLESISAMVRFNDSLAAAANAAGGSFARAGAPWEFNLRDILRWCDLAEHSSTLGPQNAVERLFGTLYLQRLRTYADRKQCASFFNDAFGCVPSSVVERRLFVDGDALCIGDARIARGESKLCDADNAKLGLIPGQFVALEAVAHCVQRGWMTILVGAAASGKTTIIQLLAALSGNKLRQAALTAATDTSELLGSFEQRDPSRDRAAIEEDVLLVLKTICGNSSTWTLGAQGFYAAWSAWESYRTMTRTSVDISGGDTFTALCGVLSLMHEIDGGEYSLDLMRRVERLGQPAWAPGPSPDAGRFEWVDGVLLNAVMNGDWVLLENANLCSPTVLDRLNPLLEPEGFLLVNECGLTNGEPRIVRAHPSFRLFLSIDPRHGEVSRAMRNRGVEVFLLAPEQAKENESLAILPPPLCTPSAEPTLMGDLGKILESLGVPGGFVQAIMINAHMDLAQFLSKPGMKSISSRDIAEWALLAIELLARGHDVQVALATSWSQVYMRGESNDVVRIAAFDAFQHACADAFASLGSIANGEHIASDATATSVLYQPMSCPRVVISNEALNYNAWDDESRHRAQTALLEGIAAQIAGQLVDADHLHLLSPTVSAALPVAKSMQRLGYDVGPTRSAANNDQSLDALFITLHASARRIVDVVIKSGDSQNTAGIIARLTVFAQMTKLESLPKIHDELLAVLSALHAVDEHPVCTSSRREDFTLRLLIVRGALCKAKTALHVQRSSESVQLGCASCLQMSVWRRQDRAARVRAAPVHVLVDVMSVILGTGAQFEDELLRLMCTSETVSHEDFECVVQFQDWRLRLEELGVRSRAEAFKIDPTSGFVSSSDSVETITVTWIKVRESLSSLLSRTAVNFEAMTAAVEQFQHAAAAMDRSLEIPAGKPVDPLLWKYAGRPSLPKSATLLNTESRVREICRALQSRATFFTDIEHTLTKQRIGGDSALDHVTFAASCAAIAAGVGLRAAALEGLCFFAWTHINGTGNASANESQIEREADHIPILLGEKCTIRAKMIGIITDKSMVDDIQDQQMRVHSHISDLPAQELLKSLDKEVPWTLEVVGNVKIPAYPALGFPAWSLKWDSCARLHAALIPIAELWSIATQSRLLNDLTMRLIVFPPSDDVLMSAHEAALAAQGLTFGIAASPRSPADFVAHRHLLWLYGDLRKSSASEKSQALRENVHDMWVRWHASQWDNALDSVPSALVSNGGKNLSIVSPVPALWEASSGPIRFERATATCYASSIIANANVGCAERLPRMVQLRIASRLLRFERNNPVQVSKEDWVSLSALTAQVLLCHKGLLEEESSAERLHGLLSAVREIGHPSLAGLPKSACEQRLAQLNQACTSLCDVYAPLAAMADDVMRPLLRLICEGSAHKDVLNSAALSGDAGARDRGRRGNAWALLGLLRLNLLLPAGLSDPAVTVRTELWHLDTVLEREVGPLVGVLTWQQRTPCAPNVDADSLDACIRQEKRLSSEREHLRALALPRPAPSRWAALRREVVQFREGLAATHRITALLDKCASLEPSESSIMEAEHWLSSSAQWSARLEENFKAYRDITQPLQLAVYELRRGLALAADSAKSRINDTSYAASAAAALFSFPSVVSSAFEGSAALMLSEARVLRALTVAENSAAAHLPSNSTSGDLEVATLRVALTSALTEARRDGALSSKSWRRLKKCFDSFAALYESCREEDLEAERMAAEVFRQATKAPSSRESNEGDDKETEERAYRVAFKDFAEQYSEFKDAPGAALMLDHDCVEENAKEEDVVEANMTRAARMAGILEGELAEELVNVHYAALATLRGGPTHGAEDSANEQEKIVRSTRLAKYGKYVRNLSSEEALRASEFARAYDTGIAVLKASQLVLPASVDYAARLGHSLRAALEQSAVSRPALSVEALGASPYESQATPEEEAAAQANEKKTKAQLEEDAAADALDAELTVGGCPGEMALIVPPVAAARRRLTALLEEWPEHPLLTQLAEICDRMLGLPLLGPVKSGLTGIELLLARAQIWEESAAAHTSLKAELGECAKLALRWRARELRTWPRLLARCSERHASRAKRTWFAIHRLLNSMKSQMLRGEDSDVGSISENVVNMEEIKGVTLALEEYLQSSTIGEFDARLELIWCFYAEMEVEIRSCAARGVYTTKHDAALCAVLYNIWRYYSQFQSTVAKHVDSVRKPCESKLRNHAKLAKWEDRGYHAMKIQGEANQRSLHKFVRAFDTALNGLVLPILEAASAQTGFKEVAGDGGVNSVSTVASEVKPSKDELAAVRNARLAETEAMRNADLQLLKVHRDAWATACSEACGETNEAVESAAQVAHEIRKDFREAITSMDDTSYQSRLPALVKRIGGVLDKALHGEEGHDVRTAGAESLDDFAATIARRANALRDDKAAKKAVKKKALQDLLKALNAIGIKHSRGAVPVEYRTATAWFTESAMELPRCLGAVGAEAIEAFRSADSYYYRSMARIQRLWATRGTQSPDLTSREVEIAVMSCEHLLHILRTQRATISAATAAEDDINLAYETLSCISAHKSVPSQSFTSAWLVEQRDLIDRMASACLDVGLLNRAVSAVEPLDVLKPAVPSLMKALITCKDVVSQARKRLDPFLASTLEKAVMRVGNDTKSSEAWRVTVIAPDAAIAAMQTNFDEFKRVSVVVAAACREAEEKLTTGGVGMHGANATPGWEYLRSIVDADARGYEEAFARGVLPVGEHITGDAASISSRLAVVRDNIENFVQSTLIWVQGVDAASKPIMIKREIALEGENDEEEAEGSMETYEAAVGGAMNPKRLERVVNSVREIVREVKLVADEAHAIGEPDVLRLVVARVGEIAPLLGLLRSAVRRVILEYIDFHKSSCKLESVLTALFLGLFREGFCAPSEEKEGDAGGDMMDDQAGTGMGAGEGKKDVADEIENEDQIMGMEDLEKPDEDDNGGEAEEGGIEMQNDFEGVVDDVSAGEDDEENPDVTKEAEKEMGEDGDDGDVIDERMWNSEDDKDNEDEKDQGPEKYEQGSSMKKDKDQETETRGAEDEDDDGNAPKDPQGDEEAPGEDDKNEESKPDKNNDQANAPDDEGGPKEEEIEENHGLNPSAPEPEEFEIDDDLQLDDDDDENANNESVQNEDTEEVEGASPEETPAEQQHENAEGEMNEDGVGGLVEDTMDLDDEQDEAEDDDHELATDNLADDAVAADDAMDEDGEENGPRGQGGGGGGDQDADDTFGEGGQAGANAQGAEGEGEQDTSHRRDSAVDIRDDEASQRDANTLPPPQSSTDIPSASAQGDGAGAGSSGGQGTSAPMTGGSDGEEEKKRPPQQKQSEANPHRSLGDALKSWRDRLNVVGDASEDKANAQEGGGDPNSTTGEEYEFERDAEKDGMNDADARGEGGVQTLANATEEQALRHNMNDVPERQDDDDGADADLEKMEIREGENVKATDEGKDGDERDDEDGDGRGASKQRKKTEFSTKRDVPRDAATLAPLEGDDVADDRVDQELVPGGEGEGGEDSIIALQLELTSLREADGLQHELTAEDIERARIEAEQSLTQFREKSPAERGNDASAQNLWRNLEQLTTALSAELAEKLRLILEPTLASRLQGDYKTGKRLNMRKIIPYIASDFRKDKIWLRRSRPSQRKYQVLIAIDDSRSMAENHCGHIALESMVLLARAMTRLEVGEIGVFGFGAGANAVRTLHPLGAPFTDQQGPMLVSKLTFAEDNTLADRPMVQLLETMAARLTIAREQLRGGGTKLQQLVLIVADGRFHEKEALRRCMREIGAQRGLLIAFIVLDNPQNSLLNMQSVSFEGGRPVMKKYLDSFPFPFYVLVQDVSQLPATLSDLLRQWFEMASSQD